MVKTDNGPPFNGQEFAAFTRHLNFRHQKITPLWPQANGTVERFMATIKKTMQQAELARRDIQPALNEVLWAYRTMPHSTTNQCPATLMLGRVPHTRIPTTDAVIQSRTTTSDHETLVELDRIKKLK